MSNRDDSSPSQPPPDICRRCGGVGVGEDLEMTCGRCLRTLPSGVRTYECRCGDRWVAGADRTFRWDSRDVCEGCVTRVAGSCEECGAIVTPANSDTGAGLLLCHPCAKFTETVWCPVCGDTYLHCGFRRLGESRAMRHAAALAEHYVRNHVSVDARVWESATYRRRPPYRCDDPEEIVGGWAIRRLADAVADHLRDGTFPASAQVGARDLLGGFADLLSAEGETLPYVESVRKSL